MLETLAAIGSIVVMDLVLGADNAIIIAMASRMLPARLRRQAIIWGTVGAVAVRGALAVIAVWLLMIPALQFVGGLLLFWIALKLLKQEPRSGDPAPKGRLRAGGNTVAGAIQTIVFADLLMGTDNILAIAGAANGHPGLVIFGLALSVPIIVGGSTVVLGLMDRFPAIVALGAAVVAWTAGRMIVHDHLIGGFLTASIPYVETWLPLVLVLLVLAVDWLRKRKEEAKEKDEPTPGHPAPEAERAS
ncbi:MAG: TerC family protein [Thermoanaerobacterales bacterium]|nr:TerC family protein [Bacillota bacterium]MDI6907673.1 TerC family protein [Thermoanaerobacterales bacterium]